MRVTAILLILLSLKLHAQTLLTNLPQVFLDTTGTAPGIITGVELDSINKKLYIAGSFVKVGSSKRNGFAVIDMVTGTVLNDLSFIDLTDLTSTNHVNAKLKLYNNRLYVGGSFQNQFSSDFLFSVNLVNNNYRSLYPTCTLSDFEIVNGKIYTSGASFSGAAQELEVNEMDTLGNITWTKSIVYIINEHLTCLAARNNLLFVGGMFSSFGGMSCKNIAKVDLTTHTIANWQLNPLPGPGNGPCFETLDIAVLPNDVLIDIGNGPCATPAKNVAGFNISTGNINSGIQQVPYYSATSYLISESDTAYWYTTSTLKEYSINGYISAWSPVANQPPTFYSRKAGYLFIGGNFTTVNGSARKGFAGYCLAPTAPKKVSSFTKACRGQGNIIYSVSPVKDATAYSWSYTGTGVTVTPIGAGTSAWLYISSTATSGTIKVCAKSYCGTSGDTLYVPFTVYALPNANAGPDVVFTCSHNVDTLSGSSTTAGATFSWTGPLSFYSTAPITQVTNTIAGGNYVLWVTDPVSGCYTKDTAKVIFDTAAPTLNHNLPHGLLTCTNSIVTLDASSLYPPGYLLHWSGSSFSQNNPANVTATGNYTLTLTGTNDCINKDTFNVLSNTIPPNLTAPTTLDTLTCSRDSIQLPASSTANAAVLFWVGPSPNPDTLINNAYTHLSGVYTAHAIDTLNGCTNQLIRSVSQYKTPPAVMLPAGTFNVNCSFSTAVLNGSSPTPGATLNWTGPNNFSSANPATAASPGYYVLEATNPQNGCTKKDSLQVTLQNILLVTSSNDTTICNGSSASITTSPIGGTPPFIYSWNNGGGNTSASTVSPNITTDYVVTIVDNAGCIGTDTVRVAVPAPVSDSVNTFQPCDPNNPNGQVQAFGTGGIPPYQYALNGSAFQSNGIFSNLNFGTYTVTIHDSLGCSTSFTAVIDSTSTLPAPDFILSTNQIQGDTFVLVDISNPRPDSVHWIVPSNCSIINNDPFNPIIVNADTGAFQITMIAWFGTCEMQLTKNIVVIPADTNIANSHNNNGISNLTLYPNPNNGQFTVDVDLYKKQSFAIFIFDALANEILRIPFTNSDHASIAISLTNPAPGTYILKVIAEYDSRTKSFLITQH